MQAHCPRCLSPVEIPPDGNGPRCRCAGCGLTIAFQQELTAEVAEVESEPGRPPSKELLNIGRFRIVRRIGRGGFGTVYEAYDPELDRMVALKVPRQDLPESAKEFQRFTREARNASQLHHPRIVPILGKNKNEEKEKEGRRKRDARRGKRHSDHRPGQHRQRPESWRAPRNWAADLCCDVDVRCR
jgi:hypothetical protein